MSDNEEMNNQSEEESSSDTFNYSSSDDARKLENKVQSPKVGIWRNAPKPKSFDLCYPDKIQKILINAEEHVKQLQAKIRSTQQRNRRLEGQVLRLKNLVKHLKSVHR